MTFRTALPASATPAAANRVDHGALDATLNYWLKRISYELEGEELLAETNLGPSASDAAVELVSILAAEQLDAQDFFFSTTFRLGLRIAARILNDPLGDPREAILELFREAIKSENEYRQVPA